VRRALETLVFLALPAIAVAVCVLRLESPVDLGPAAATCLLALLPGVLRPLWARAAATVAGALVVAWLAFGPAPWDLLPGRDAEWLDPIGSKIDHGLLDFGDQAVPLDPVERPEMHGLVLVWLYLLLLTVGLAVAARRIVLAAGLVVAGAGWAATLVERRSELAIGALLLAAVLWLVLLEREPAPRRALSGLVAGVAVVGLAAGAASSVSAQGVLDWRDWNLYQPGGQVGLQYIWNANYRGIDFPHKQTTVLRIRAPQRALYWRASTLDTFTADRWIENLYPIALGGRPGRITSGPMIPDEALDRSKWVRQQVRIEALEDAHLVGAATPMRIEAPQLGRLFYLEGGVTTAPQGVRRGQLYVVHSYAPEPTPLQLRRSQPKYPPGSVRYVTLERAGLPLYGEPGRKRTIDRILRNRGYESLWPYRPLWREAQRLAAGAESPYAATLAVERWLRAEGGFRYEEQPVQTRGIPPLADFATRTRAGYCQHFAGTMALMLRLLGVPSRVAVGFTSGTWRDGVWTVTDHQAHAWVEAWFDGWGWLTFDPTPGRGTVSATYTLASDSADARAALGVPDPPTVPDLGPGGIGVGAVAEPGSRDRRPWLTLILPVLVALLAAVLALAKFARRRSRYLTRDARRLASAARAELADWLRDQGIEVATHATARDVANVTESRLGVSARAFATAVSRARYGPPGDADDAAHDARRELRLVLHALRARLSPRQRLRGFFALRSLRRA
jgi:transglutaminase-like putative cysteine protease